MPPKEYEKGQLFFGIGDGDWKPLGDCIEETACVPEPENHENHKIDKNVEFEISFNMDKKTKKKLIKAIGVPWLINNWRKLHGIPMKRKSRWKVGD